MRVEDVLAEKPSGSDVALRSTERNAYEQSHIAIKSMCMV